MKCKFCEREMELFRDTGACSECLSDERSENARAAFRQLRKRADSSDISGRDDYANAYARVRETYRSLEEGVDEALFYITQRKPDRALASIRKALAGRRLILSEIREMLDSDSRALDAFEEYVASITQDITDYHLTVPDDPEYLVPIVPNEDK